MTMLSRIKYKGRPSPYILIFCAFNLSPNDDDDDDNVDVWLDHNLLFHYKTEPYLVFTSFKLPFCLVFDRSL